MRSTLLAVLLAAAAAAATPLGAGYVSLGAVAPPVSSLPAASGGNDDVGLEAGVGAAVGVAAVLPCRGSFTALVADPARPGGVWAAVASGAVLRCSLDAPLRSYGPAEGLVGEGCRRLLVAGDQIIVLSDDGRLVRHDEGLDRFVAVPGAPVPLETGLVHDAAVFEGSLFLSMAGEGTVRRIPVAGPPRCVTVGGDPLPDGGAPRFLATASTLLAWNASGCLTLSNGRFERVEALEGAPLAGMTAAGDRILVSRGPQGMVLQDEGRWRSLPWEGQPGDGARRLLSVADELWVGLDAGLVRRRADGSWAWYTAPSGLRRPGMVLSAVGDGSTAWFGTSTGELWEYRLADDVWRRLTAGQGVPGGAVRSLALSGSRLWVGTDDGLASMGRVGGYPQVVLLPPAPRGPLVAVAPLSRDRALVADADGWVCEVRPGAGGFGPRLFREKVERLVATDDGRVLCFSQGRLAEWSLSPPRRGAVRDLPPSVLEALVEEPGLVFGAARDAVFRVDVRSAGVTSPVWSPEPPLRLGRSNWRMSTLAALAVDGLGIVVGTRQGMVERVLRYEASAPLGELGRFSTPRMAVTALAVLGPTLYAALDGAEGGMWSRPSAGRGEAWTRIKDSSAWGGGVVGRVVPVGGRLALMVPGAVAFLEPGTGRVELVAAGRGTTCGADRDLAVQGTRLWVAGRGLTVIDVPVASR